MNDITVRSGYSRNSVLYRKKNRVRKKNKRGEIIKIQFMISLLIFFIIWGISKTNTNLASLLTDNIKRIILSDIEINDIYSKINDIFRFNDGTDGDGEREQGHKEIKENPKEDIRGMEKDDKGSNLEFTAPVDGVVSSLFGEILDPVTNRIKFHSGVDIEASNDTQVKAAEEGEVIEISEHKLYGLYVKVKHQEETITIYGHCSDVLVTKGTKVSKGDIIAKIGNPNIFSTAHLHFETWVNGIARNPLEFVKIPIVALNSNETL